MSFIIILGLIICIYVLSIIFSLSSIWIMKYIDDIKFYCRFIFKIIFHKIYFMLTKEYMVGGIFIDCGNIIKVKLSDVKIMICNNCFYSNAIFNCKSNECYPPCNCINDERINNDDIIFEKIGISYNCINCVQWDYNLNNNLEKIYACRNNKISVLKKCRRGLQFMHRNKYLRIFNYLRGGITIFNKKEI